MSEAGESRSGRSRRDRDRIRPATVTTRSSSSSSRSSRSSAAAAAVAPTPPTAAKKKLRSTQANNKASAVVSANSYLGKLSPSALGKYQKHYRLRGKSDTAETLLKSVVRHFEAQNVEEAEVVQNFLLALQKVAGH